MTQTLKRVASIALILAAGGFAYERLRGPQGVHALFEKYRAIRQLEDRNEELRKDNERRRQRNEELKKPEALQLEIRKRLEMVQPNETQFKLPEKPAQE